MDSDYAPLLGPKEVALAGTHPTTGTTKLRWLALLTFSLMAIMQGLIWAMPGPLSTSLLDLFGVDDTETQLMLAWGPIAYLIFAAPAAWWLDRRGGLRQTTLACIALIVISCVLRCLARHTMDDGSRYLLHASFFLNAVTGPIAMGAASKFAEVWFPPSERATATAIAAECNILGGAAAFLMGPFLVTASGEEGLSQFLLLQYILVGMAGLNALLALIYFPAGPPLPPSASAHEALAVEASFSLASLWRGVKTVSKNKDFMVMAAAYGLCGGMTSAWASTLTPNLTVLHISQTAAGWIGFAGILGGNVVGLVVGLYLDRVRRHKRLLVALNAGAGITAAAFACVVQGNFTLSHDAAYALAFVFATLAVTMTNALAPVYFDLAVEVTFPVPAGTVIMLLTTYNNAGTLLLLAVPVDRARTAFNWIFAGTILACVLLLAGALRESFKRAQVDAAGVTAEGEAASDPSRRASQGLLPAAPGAAVVTFEVSK